MVHYDNLNSGTLSWEASAGQLFSISNNLTSGSIFSVNDVSGIPSIDVDADGTVLIAPYGSTEYVGVGATDPTQKLHVDGNLRVTGAIYDSNNDAGTSGYVLKSTATGTDWADPTSISGLQGIQGVQGTQGIQGPGGLTTTNADTLDSLDSTQFLRSDTADTMSAPLTINGGTSNSGTDATLYVTATNNNDWGLIVDKYNGSATEYGVQIDVASSASYALRVRGNDSEVFRVTGGGSITAAGSNTVWHAGNDGAGSGLDADFLDGQQGSYYLDTSSTAQTKSGDIRIGGSTYNIAFGLNNTQASNSVGHTATYNEGIFWHVSNTDYAIYRTAGAWTANTYQQLKLSWPTGIILDGGSAYTLSGVNISAGNLLMGGTTIINASRQLSNLTYGGNTIWHSGNDGAGSGLDADNLDGYTWDSSGKNVRATNFYADDWFRNYNAGEGLYNEATGCHFVSDASDEWTVRDAGNSIRIEFQTNGTTLRGSVYADNGNTIGFLNNANEWGLRYLTNNGNSPNLYFVESGNESWTGNPGNDIGKIEYHSNRFYIASGANSTYVCQFRKSATDVARVENDGKIYAQGSNLVWHAGNDGSGSGLDADTVDGYQGRKLNGLAVLGWLG